MMMIVGFHSVIFQLYWGKLPVLLLLKADDRIYRGEAKKKIVVFRYPDWSYFFAPTLWFTIKNEILV